MTFTKAALKVLKNLDGRRRSQVMKRLQLLDGGDTRNVKPLTGIDGERLRIGKLRVIFRRSGAGIEVLDVGFRRDVYKRK